MNMPANRTSTSCQLDTSRSINDWGTFSVDALRQKCKSFSLSTDGRKNILQKRLFDHFNSNITTTTTLNHQISPLLSHSSQNEDLLAAINNLRAEVETLKNKVNHDNRHIATNNDRGPMATSNNPALQSSSAVNLVYSCATNTEPNVLQPSPLLDVAPQQQQQQVFAILFANSNLEVVMHMTKHNVPRLQVKILYQFLPKALPGSSKMRNFLISTSVIIASQHATTAMHMDILQRRAHIDLPHYATRQIIFVPNSRNILTSLPYHPIHLTNLFVTNCQHQSLSPQPAATPYATDSTRLVFARNHHVNYCMSATCVTRQDTLVPAVFPEPIRHSSLNLQTHYH